MLTDALWLQLDSKALASLNAKEVKLIWAQHLTALPILVCGVFVLPDRDIGDSGLVFVNVDKLLIILLY